jgi:hypothetical protein
LEPVFHADSYGYRPGKSAIDAVRQARQRCWRYDWVLDIGLPQSRLSDDHHQLPVALPCPLPASHQHGDFLIAAQDMACCAP